MTISEKILEKLKDKNLTQKYLAEKIEMSEMGLSNSLKRDDFKISMLQKISDVLEVDINYFFTDSSLTNNEFLEGILKLIVQQDYTYYKSMVSVLQDLSIKEGEFSIIQVLGKSGNFNKYTTFTNEQIEFLFKQKYINQEFYKFIKDFRIYNFEII